VVAVVVVGYNAKIRKKKKLNKVGRQAGREFSFWQHQI
jgi:hypothetical protein